MSNSAEFLQPYLEELQQHLKTVSNAAHAEPEKIEELIPKVKAVLDNISALCMAARINKKPEVVEMIEPVRRAFSETLTRLHLARTMGNQAITLQ